MLSGMEVVIFLTIIIIIIKDGSDELLMHENNFTSADGIPCRQYRTKCLLETEQVKKNTTICQKDLDCDDDAEFACQDGVNCIPAYAFCDGESDCGDGSDEVIYNSNFTPADGIPCRWLELICLLPTRQVEKNATICRQNPVCNDDEFACQDGTKCISSYEFCDGASNCRDGSDEIIYGNNFTSVDGIPCRQHQIICLLEAAQVYKNTTICSGKPSCGADEFDCYDGTQCVPAVDFCDDSFDCRDASDELIYKGQELEDEIECDANDWGNYDKKCLLPAKYICDGISHCKNDFDECMCNKSKSGEKLNEKCFKCLNHPLVIKSSYVCDGIIHCPDLSDECICRKRGNLPEICRNVQWVQEQHKSLEQQWQCKGNNESAALITRAEICDGVANCNDSSDERDCENYCSGSSCEKLFPCMARGVMAQRCDGVPECEDPYEEECKICENKPAFCLRLDELYGTYICDDGEEVIGTDICNGKADCSNGEEELNCTNRFYCNSGSPINILSKLVCNGQKDCNDSSDEMNCSNETHFYCNDEKEPKFINIQQLCDGSEDCFTGRDECLEECITSRFSSVDSMIANNFFVAFTWVISIFALVGNLFVFGRSFSDVFFPKKDISHNELNNKLLLLNLSLSDLLVGIYTTGICIKNATITKNYCRIDREWRSGFTCSVLGALLLIGSENSVFTLTIITWYRMKTLLRPFAKQTKMKKILSLMVITWFASFVLALIPFAETMEDYFVDSIWYERNPLFATIDRADITTLSRWLLPMKKYTDQATLEAIGTWSLLESQIKSLNSDYKVARRFGYYSTHGVCLPTFFPDPKTDNAWLYSLIIIVVNFLAFFFIMIGYILIYRETMVKSLAVSDDLRKKRARKMQTRVGRIVLTDFLCWMPISIMAFLQVSGIDIPKDAYVPVGLVIVPINSALNPFLYSDVPEYIWEKLRLAGSWLYRNTLARCEFGERVRRLSRRADRDSGLEMTDQSQPLERETQETAI